ncbi:MAG: FkbM family methyltransferase [Pseudolabrys sp.]
MAKMSLPIRTHGGISLPHQARSFAELPRPDRAASLLAEIAAAPCAFSPVAADRPLALYGAGSLGRLARDFLKTVGHSFVMAVDRDVARIADAPDWRGVRVVRPEDVPAGERRTVRLAVSLVTSPYVPLERSLANLGFEDIVPFYDLAESFRRVHPLSNGWFAAPLTAEDRGNTEAVLARWHDDLSRAHHLQFLAWRRLRQEWTFADAPVANDNRFFIPELRSVLRGGEVFVDGGAHHGEVSEAFAKAVGTVRKIVAVEPDPASRARLAGNFSARLKASAVVLDCALSDEEGEALFHDDLDYASQLSPTGRTRVMRRRLDTLDLAPTVIKLHLEGAELPALKGARDTLLKHRPILLATVYHNEDGIWKTAHWLMDTLPDYRFLFRAHSWCGTGAVIYAIPEERAA